MNQTRSLVWFRQDLRLRDNPALLHACEQGDILPVFILDDTHSGQWQHGSASRWWLSQSLQHLHQALGEKLLCLAGDPLNLIPSLVAQYRIDNVYWNRCYEPWRIQRDKQLKTALENNSTTVKSFNGSLLWEPWQVLKKDQTPYRVFTPYYRKGCLQQIEPRLPLGAPKAVSCIEAEQKTYCPASLKLVPEIAWYSEMAELWQPGEQGASEQLSTFVGGALCDYDIQRDIPGVRGTSWLSPHLHFGELSPNQAWYAALHSSGLSSDNKNLQRFLSELGWREFSYYLLYHFPHLPEQNFNDRFDNFPWRQDDQQLKRWQQGQTGIPIIDAGMRQLWRTGYQHNRVRMIAASFLVKNLLIHWRHGEAWYWDCLLDADLASNSASWQWVAGSGADAAPYFRIFNPVTQGQKFDPSGTYVRQYCPELRALPDKYIHTPWEAPAEVLAKANIRLGQDYPAPIADLKVTRQRALDAFSQIKNTD